METSHAPISNDRQPLLKRWWSRLFGPTFLPDASGAPAHDKKQFEAEAVMVMGDEGPVADPSSEVIETVPVNHAPASVVRRRKASRGRVA